MKTIEIKLTLIESIEELYNYCDGHQITAQNVVNRRVYNNSKGWHDVEFSRDFMEVFASQVSNILGGQNKTKAGVKNTLRWAKPRHWGLDRVLLSKYGNNDAHFTYCAGQDYDWETSEIRKALK